MFSVKKVTTNVTCDKCGAKTTAYITGNKQTRKHIKENGTHLCENCRAKEFAEDNAKNAEINKEKGLVELIGSQKQIAWAETIRADTLKLLEKEDELLEEMELDFENPTKEMMNAKLQGLLAQDKASWWIENRSSLNSLGGISHLFTKIKDIDEIKQINKEKELLQDIEASSTIYPKEPKTQTIAKISIKGINTIEIHFPEKNEKFRELVKAHNFSWASGVWQRNINEVFNGKIEDRVSQMGNLLLNNGFVVCILDENMRQNAINANYEKEQTRWIGSLNNKDEFSIWWAWGDDFYSVAKKLPSARWSRGTMKVSKENYEAILDFAERYEFGISPKAKELIEKAKKAKEKALIPEIKKQEKKEKVIAPEIDPELQDD